MTEKTFKERFLSGSPARTILQLVVASIVVGAIFTFIGISPKEFWRGVFNTGRNIVSYIGDSFGEVALSLLTYLLIGAAIVVPLWLISRLFAGKK